MVLNYINSQQAMVLKIYVTEPFIQRKTSGKTTDINENNANDAQGQECSKNIRQEVSRLDCKEAQPCGGLLLLARICEETMFSFLPPCALMVHLLFTRHYSELWYIRVNKTNKTPSSPGAHIPVRKTHNNIAS